MVSRSEAKQAVSRIRPLTPDQLAARPVPGRKGAWFLWERDSRFALVDDCVWVVFASGLVGRAVPEGNPIHEPTDLDALEQELAEG